MTLNYYYLLQNTARQSHAFKKLTSKTTPPLTLKSMIVTTIINGIYFIFYEHTVKYC